jgi:ATP synthase protein I
MPDAHQHKHTVKTTQSFSQQVGATETRKIKARTRPTPGVWSGLGMMGLVGWSVTLPTLLCTALGIWLDSHYPGKHHWTLALLAAGLAIGCLNAWHWVANEVHAMQADPEDSDE